MKVGSFSSLRFVVAVCAALAAVGLSGCMTTTACPAPCEDRLVVTFPGLDLSKKPTVGAWRGVSRTCDNVPLSVATPATGGCDVPAVGELSVPLGYLEAPTVVTVRVRFADGTMVTRNVDVDFGGPLDTSECRPECRVVRKAFEL